MRDDQNLGHPACYIIGVNKNHHYIQIFQTFKNNFNEVFYENFFAEGI